MRNRTQWRGFLFCAKLNIDLSVQSVTLTIRNLLFSTTKCVKTLAEAKMKTVNCSNLLIYNFVLHCWVGEKYWVDYSYHTYIDIWFDLARVEWKIRVVRMKTTIRNASVRLVWGRCLLAINRHKIVNKTWKRVIWMWNSNECNLLCTVILMRLRFVKFIPYHEWFEIDQRFRSSFECSEWKKMHPF